MNKIPHIKTGSPKKLTFTNFSEPGFILGLLTIIVAMMVWNWQLLLSLVVGITVMLLSYSMQKWNWQLHWLEIRNFFKSADSRLVLAVVSGGVATIITYMVGSIWVDSASPWLAAGTIIQGMATVLTLGLLVWQILNVQINQADDYIDQLLNQLSENESLKRLLALRKLNKHLLNQNLTIEVKEDVTECLHLLLNQEKETIIQEAVLDCLQSLDDFKVISANSANSQEVLIPMQTKKKKIMVD